MYSSGLSVKPGRSGLAVNFGRDTDMSTLPFDVSGALPDLLYDSTNRWVRLSGAVGCLNSSSTTCYTVQPESATGRLSAEKIDKSVGGYYLGMCGRRMAPVFYWRQLERSVGVAIDRSDVERVAKLARLALSNEEIERFRGDLEAILDYVGQIQSTDTRGVSEELNPDWTENVFREDKVRPSLTRDEALSNAPDTDGKYFRVPLMLPGEGH